MLEKAKEMLDGIGCTNYTDIISCELIYENAVEKSYRIVTDLGEVDFRINRDNFSIIDYHNTSYKFNRNVNLHVPYPVEKK